MAGTRYSTQRVAAAILAGGQASRHGGIPKGLLEATSGSSIIENQITQLTSSGLSEIIIVANNPEPYQHCGPQIIPDLRSGIGPLAGIEAALAHYTARCDATLLLPCDLPGITAGEMSRLKVAFINSSATVAVAITDDSFWQPLCTVVHNSMLPAIRRAIDVGQHWPLLLWRAMGALGVYFDDATAFFNINTPQDLTRWRAMRADKQAGGRCCRPRNQRAPRGGLPSPFAKC